MSRSARARLDEELDRAYEELEAQGLARSLEVSSGIDLESNDYLGWAKDPTFRRQIASRIDAWAAAGTSRLAPGARLLGGQLLEHAAVEARLAGWLNEEAALLLPSGWQANCALLSALAGPQDRVISDALNHASLIDAIRLVRTTKVVVPHLDLEAYRRALERPHPGGRTFVVVESVYSMDGDLAPLGELAELVEHFEANLLVDEAHATGLYGERGTGRVEELGLEGRLAARTVTFGKAMALQGAAIVGSKQLIRWLIQRARPFLFSTAVSPLLVLGLEVALDRLEGDPLAGRRARMLARRLRDGLRGVGLSVAEHDSPIVPLILGRNERALQVAAQLRWEGFGVRAVRPPTVPEGSARIRFSVHADLREEEIDRLVATLSRVLS